MPLKVVVRSHLLIKRIPLCSASGLNKIKIHFDTSQLCCGVVHLDGYYSLTVSVYCRIIQRFVQIILYPGKIRYPRDIHQSIGFSNKVAGSKRRIPRGFKSTKALPAAERRP
jgi:hypothetical protein